MNPYTPPSTNTVNKIRYPFGKATILWIFAFFVCTGWSTGSFITYALSLYFQQYGVISPLEEIFLDNPFLQGSGDLAGFLGYMSSFLAFLSYFTWFVFRHKHTWKLPLPNLRIVSSALLKSVLVLGPAWILIGGFFELFRYNLPGDGNWPAIACLTGLAACHVYLIKLFIEKALFLQSRYV